MYSSSFRPPTPAWRIGWLSYPIRGRVASLVFCAALLFSFRVFGDYPIASNRYLADPSTLVTQDRVYVYCSNDDESPVEGTYNIPSVVCISTCDMKNWTDHGVVFDAARDTAWAKKAWAPSAIERDGKYFLYFGNGGGSIGVAVAESPTGPFKDIKGGQLINGNTPGVKPFDGGWLFDPGVFIDDDGQAYIYFGGNGDDKVRVAKLNRDMISLNGDVIKMTAPNFFEAAWVFKREGIYYLSYSTTPKTGMRIDYMTSGNPIDSFTYKGVLAGQPPVNHNNNHSAQFLFKGNWYHICHNRIVAKEAGIPMGFRRNIALEPLAFNADGSIKQVEYAASDVPQIGHLDPYVRVEGETFAAQSGVKTEPSSTGGMNLAYLDKGDWVKIMGVDFGSNGARRFIASVASAELGGIIEVRLDGPDGKLVGTCQVGNTGGWQTWQSVSCEVAGAVGVQNLCLRFVGGPKPLFNLDYWKFK